MQIHELTKKQLNEVDIAGAGGLISGAKAAFGALKQPGGAKDLGRTFTPGQGQGLTSTAALSQSDFAKRMQAVKNNAAAKQVAANMQAQWNQYRTTLAPAQPTAQPTAPATSTLSTQATNLSDRQSRLANKANAYKSIRKESLQLTEAAGITQLSDWYKSTMVPKEYATYAADYLKDPIIQKSLETIVAAENQPDAIRQKTQSPAFLDLVAATSAKSQQLVAANPQLATASRVAPGNASRSPGAQAAKTNIAKAAGISSAQLAAIEKVVGELSPVTSRDPNTIAYLRALGFDVQ